MDELNGLRHLALMIKEARLSELAARQADCVQTRRMIADLSSPTAEVEDISLAARADISLRYQAWAEGRRIKLNLQLATQLAAVHRAEDAARLAFGRSLALDTIFERQQEEEQSRAVRKTEG